jgi:hypothetical protein
MIALVLWELNLHFSVVERLMVIINRLSCCISITPDFFIVGECILLRMYQISKYRQPLFTTVFQRALLYTYIKTCFG